MVLSHPISEVIVGDRAAIVTLLADEEAQPRPYVRPTLRFHEVRAGERDHDFRRAVNAALERIQTYRCSGASEGSPRPYGVVERVTVTPESDQEYRTASIVYRADADLFPTRE